MPGTQSHSNRSLYWSYLGKSPKLGGFWASQDEAARALLLRGVAAFLSLVPSACPSENPIRIADVFGLLHSLANISEGPQGSFQKRLTASCCQSATRTVRLGGHVHYELAVYGLVTASVPVGSPRKSAAIIPSVNETLTSGLPIGSGGKCL
jgi:hypothetical protein